MRRYKVCVPTGTRAEYGLLLPLLRALNEDSFFELHLVAIAAHLSPEFGLTFRDILADGFVIEKIETLLSSDTGVGIAKSMALGTIGFADTFARINPDIVLITGDRFEMLAAAQAALVARIPIGHIAGGDITEGAFDDAIRHSITKMSALHFPTNRQSAQRIQQMGELPERVHVVGSLGIDAIRYLKLLSREEIESQFGISFKEKNLLVTFHPVTLVEDCGLTQLRQLLMALRQLPEDQYGIVFTKPNADNAGREFSYEISCFADHKANVSVHTNLGHRGYLSTLAVVDAVVGNSSSGLYEAPSFQKATVNIGERQRGRLCASSVIQCEPMSRDILLAIEKATSLDFGNTVNPYGDGNAAARIVEVLKKGFSRDNLLQKSSTWS